MKSSALQSRPRKCRNLSKLAKCTEWEGFQQVIKARVYFYIKILITIKVKLYNKIVPFFIYLICNYYQRFLYC